MSEENTPKILEEEEGVSRRYLWYDRHIFGRSSDG